jgi:hypothetical protein
MNHKDRQALITIAADAARDAADPSLTQDQRDRAEIQREAIVALLLKEVV